MQKGLFTARKQVLHVCLLVHVAADASVLLSHHAMEFAMYTMQAMRKDVALEAQSLGIQV